MIVACAVLAAGGSTRLGEPKQLLSVSGQPLLRRVVDVACASRCEHVGVVLADAAPAIEEALRGTNVTRLHNPAWQTGMASSLHVAVRWAQALRADALLVTACDQPHLSLTQLDALYDAFQQSGHSAASAYADVLGVPALLEARHFAALLAIEGDRGAAGVLRHDPDVVHVPWPEGAVDLDTPQDVARFFSA